MLTASTLAEAFARIPGAAVATDPDGNVRLIVAVRDADDGGVQLAIRPVQLLGGPALVFLAHVGPEADLSLAALTHANAKLGGVGVVMSRGHCMLRLAMPLTAELLAPTMLKAISLAVAQRADALRRAAHQARPASLAGYFE